MDLLRREIGGRLPADRAGVGLLAARQRADARRLSAMRQVVRLDVGMQPGIGREHDLADGGSVIGGQPVLVGGGESGRDHLQRPEEDVFRRVVGHERLELGQHALHEDLRLHDALGHAFLHIGDGGVHPGAEALRPADEIAEIPLGLERMQALSRPHLGEGQRRTRELTDRQQVKELRIQLAAGGEAPLERVVAQLLRGREAGAIVGGERREVFVAQGGDLGAMFGRDLVLPDGLVAGITVAIFGSSDGEQG